jgi:hypothetical protein
MTDTTNKPLRGFGFTIGFPGGAIRNWYAGADGIERWADSDQPVNCEVTPEGRAIAAAYKKRQESDK